MEKISRNIFIAAPKEKVWHTMLDDTTYRIWTKAFNETSYYRGDWSEGSKILFIGSMKDEKSGEVTEGGMVSMIRVNRPYEHISIEHIGLVGKDGVEDTTSDAVKTWAHAFENYTFTEQDGGTLVTVDQDIVPEYKQMFDDMWSKALVLLQELAQK
jgi:hypothetical protein